MTAKIKKSNPDKHYNWLMSSDMYMAASVILCDEMLKSYTSPITSLNSDQQIDKRCGFTSSNSDYEMLMPVVFNLKHGIELFLKSLALTANPNEIIITHDLLLLLGSAIGELEKKKNKYNVDMGAMQSLLDNNVRLIVEKYYYGLYAFSTYKSNPDINNEAERYPERQNENCYKIELVNVDTGKLNNLIKEIRADCMELQKIFRNEIWAKLVTSIK
jgi:hypothetical protein